MGPALCVWGRRSPALSVSPGPGRRCLCRASAGSGTAQSRANPVRELPAQMRMSPIRSAGPSSDPRATRVPPAQICVPPIQPGASPFSVLLWETIARTAWHLEAPWIWGSVHLVAYGFEYASRDFKLKTARLQAETVEFFACFLSGHGGFVGDLFACVACARGSSKEPKARRLHPTFSCNMF